MSKSQTQLSDFTFTFHFNALEKEMATHSGVVAWRIPGMGEPGGRPSIGSHRLRHDQNDLAAAADYWKTIALTRRTFVGKVTIFLYSDSNLTKQSFDFKLLS